MVESCRKRRKQFVCLLFIHLINNRRFYFSKWILRLENYHTTGTEACILTVFWFRWCYQLIGLLWWLSEYRIHLQCRSCRRREFSPLVGKIPKRRDGNPLRYSCLENPMDRGVWWVTVCGVAKSQIQLKQLSMHTHTPINFCKWNWHWKLHWETDGTCSFPFLFLPLDIVIVP